MLRTRDANHNVLTITSTVRTISIERLGTEYCSVVAKQVYLLAGSFQARIFCLPATPAKKVATAVALNNVLEDLFCEKLMHGIPK